MIKNTKKPGVISVEVALGTALAVVTLFIALGLFSDNLSEIITNSNLSNLFNGNNSKTAFASFNRNYSNSQVDVQIMGEQGLEMLRRRANNRAIELIEAPFDSTNTHANSIAYLSTAIKAIVGQPHICVYMTKNSAKFCSEDNIGGYNYKINLDSSSAIVIQKVDATGSIVSETMTLTFSDNSVSTILSDSTVSTDSDGRSALTNNEQYKFIKNLSLNFKSLVENNVLLMGIYDSFKSSLTTDSSKNLTISDLSSTLTGLLATLEDSLSSAHKQCSVYGDLTGIDYNYPKSNDSCCNNGIWDAFSQCWVGKNEKNKFITWADSISSNISSSTSTDFTELVELFIKNSNIDSMIEVLNNDHANSPTSCEVFETTMEKVVEDYGLTGITIPTCTASTKSTN